MTWIAWTVAFFSVTTGASWLGPLDSRTQDTLTAVSGATALSVPKSDKPDSAGYAQVVNVPWGRGGGSPMNIELPGQSACVPLTRGTLNWPAEASVTDPVMAAPSTLFRLQVTYWGPGTGLRPVGKGTFATSRVVCTRYVRSPYFEARSFPQVRETELARNLLDGQCSVNP